MFRSFTLLVAICTLILTCPAQPTIGGSSAPVPGYSYTYVVASWLNLPGVGAGQVWDASGAATVGMDNATTLALGSSTAGASFPTADVAVLSGGTESYIDEQADGLYVVGSYVGSLAITAAYTDPYHYLLFPCEMGDLWTDDYTGSYIYSGNTYAQAGSGNYEATGYGSLILPWGTVTDVLRLDGTEVYTETGNGNFFEYTATFSYFYKPGLRYFLAKALDATSSFNGSPAGDQLLFSFMNANSVGYDEQQASSFGMEVFPSPADHTANIIFTAEQAVSLEVFNADGKRCMHKALGGMGAGLYREFVDVSALPAGMYSAVVNGRDGRRGVTRFVVAH